MNNRVVAGIGIAAFGVSFLAFQYGPRVAGAIADPDASQGTPRRDHPAFTPATIAVASATREADHLRRSQDDLRATVARLERRIEALEAVAETPAGDPGTGPAVLAATVEDASGAVGSKPSDAAADSGRDSAGSQVRQQLIEAGFAPEETDAIIRAVDENTLERLELRYRMARGGEEARGARARLREMPSAQELVREEFGEDAYDRYLYATGRPNRIVVRGVLKSSPAQAAGLRSGDTLLALDEEPVYALGDLMRIASTGSDADLVTLTVLREQEVLKLSVPRGPLGINASADSIDPAMIPQG